MRTQESSIGQNVLEDLVRQIVRIADPVQVILFGSMARRQSTGASDIDLLVIVRNGLHKRRTSQKIYKEVKGIKLPFDVLVATEGDVQMHGSNIGLILSKALTEGVMVYDSRARIT